MAMKLEVPIWEKSNLTLEEAVAYSGIGRDKLRELSGDDHCTFVLWVNILRRCIPSDLSRMSRK